MKKEIIELAKAFSEIVEREFTEKELAAVNAENSLRNDDTCATHDYCDANMLMDEAYKKVFGEEVDVQSEEAVDRWNSAWNLAKELRFNSSEIANFLIPAYQREFEGEYPIPQSFTEENGWKDHSWGNDACPRFENEKLSLIVWIEDKRKEYRESQGALYTVFDSNDMYMEKETCLLETEDVSELEKFVDKVKEKITNDI